MTSRLIVYIVDDDLAVLTSMSRALTKRGYHVQTFSSASQFLEGYEPDIRGCLVLDLSMPGMDGLALQRELNARGCGLPMIFITGHGGVTESVNALKSGAIDFLQKPFKQSQLLDAIERAFELFTQLEIGNAENRDFLAKYARLSEREKDLITAILEDQGEVSSKTLARKLGISHRTVDQHRAKVFIKMDVASMTELVALLVKFQTRKGPLPEG
ncbi:MAG: response regulator [Pseudomonadota bacterium]